ncbi:succinylglutamate desuccinylase/aspartoacylase family protein [Alicyclobacillus cycloheptanicus]|uniref:Deacylase n=1 Tax=Alicyclobacillus cycloheptanicus TaxID=1457 RepID=A0ABT9XH30_9BACL|nr:M14 family metallopeptidase [Alicyclobacillus cycloheptanicus]MDQ0189046.1 putative deacylase [Alicyclobacillus cycloheptanicus]WDM00183.1 succinylglutamate desuccinylase/aspartoacylase family protein [Alicyclobacillus cycloheptanicus]
MSTHARQFEQVVVTHLSNGAPLCFPLHTIQGAKPGPVLGVSAAVHGDEIIGTEIIRRLYTQLDENELSGTLKLVPVANPLAFESLTRNTPVDMNNLNRLFPGDADGWVSEQLADALVRHFLTKIDVYVDLHSGGAVPIVDYVYIQNDESLSRAFNSPVLYRPAHPYEGTTATVVAERGIPSVTVEIGGGPNYEKHIERGVQGLLNMMRHLEMLPGAVVPAPEQTVVTEIASIRPHQGGLLVPHFGFDAVGCVLEGQQPLATIYNPQTFEELEVIRAPFAHNLVILMRGEVGKVSPGDYGFMIGNLDTAEAK